jgi:hypothetical protein
VEVGDVADRVEVVVVPGADERPVVALAEDRGDRVGPSTAPATTTTVTMITAASRTTAKRRRRWMLGGTDRCLVSLDLGVRKLRLMFA